MGETKLNDRPLVDRPKSISWHRLWAQIFNACGRHRQQKSGSLYWGVEAGRGKELFLPIIIRIMRWRDTGFLAAHLPLRGAFSVTEGFLRASAAWRGPGRPAGCKTCSQGPPQARSCWGSWRLQGSPSAAAIPQDAPSGYSNAALVYLGPSPRPRQLHDCEISRWRPSAFASTDPVLKHVSSSARRRSISTITVSG